MIFEGSKEKDSSSYKINIFVEDGKLISNTIEFFIDTGASVTTMSLKDAYTFNLLDIDRNTLKVKNIHGLAEGGKIHTASQTIGSLILPNTRLTFMVDETSYFVETLRYILIVNPILNSENYRDLLRIPSVLGLDILKNYKIQFTASKIILER